jgi:alpha-L-fucosidase
MNITRRSFFRVAGATCAGGLLAFGKASAPEKFSSDSHSLQQYRCPEWFRDAKLGFWACWGPEAVPEMGDWYARNMYVEGHPQYEDHLARYGHPSKSGYKDLVPLWTGENWDPDRLIRLYQRAGAKYFCAIAQHHDNIDCWNSRFHSWNSVEMGPRKDVVGLWSKAVRKYGLRFGTTEHLGASWNWFGVTKASDTKGPLAGVPYDGMYPKYAELYHSGNAGRSYKDWYRDVPESFQREWFNRIYYNANLQTHDGTLEAVYNCKNNDDGGQFIEGSCVQDVERGVLDGINPEPWQTDTCVGDWYYKKDIAYKTPTIVIQMLVDIVSKNGNLLLNFPLRNDGTLDSREEAIIESLTQWMAVNGEAIFATRPWKVYGEGAVVVKSDKFNEGKLRYSSEDIRFTTKGKDLYAIALGWPDSGKLTIPSLGGANVHSARLLGAPDPLRFGRTGQGLQIEMPSQKPNEHAFAIRLEGAAG